MIPNCIIAKLQISEDISLMAMINDDTIHFFDEQGKDVERDILKLPEVFVLNFIDGNNRSFNLLNEGKKIDYGVLYVINKDNKIVFSSTSEENYDTYTRITSNTVILGVKEIECVKSSLLIPINSYGKLIDNNHLTNKKLIGVRDNYYLFSEESLCFNEYHLYALSPKFYDTYVPGFVFVRKFHADFLLLWKTHILYYDSNNKPVGGIKLKCV